MSNESNDMSGCIIDPCHPPIRMFINDNNQFTPSVAAEAAEVRVIRHVIFKKCKKRRDRDEDERCEFRRDCDCDDFRRDFEFDDDRRDFEFDDDRCDFEFDDDRRDFEFDDDRRDFSCRRFRSDFR